MTDSRAATGGHTARIETLDVICGFAALSVVFYRGIRLKPGFTDVRFERSVFRTSPPKLRLAKIAPATRAT